jgi:hypothetical protein
VYPYDRFRDFYIHYNRYVHEQVLDLTAVQKQRLFNYLVWNAQPENVTYRYDYFYNNCATKIRDVMVTVFGDSIKFDGSYINTTYTIRDLTDLYLHQQPWGDLGIDICLGLPMDKQATPYEYMFLPDYVESGFEHASLNNKPVVKDRIAVYESYAEEVPFSYTHPFIVLGLLLLTGIVISIWDIKRKKISSWLDILLFGSVGLIGWLLLLLWTATDHQAAARNFNLLWALPTHLVVVIAFIKKPGWLKQYFFATAALQLLLLFSWALLPQSLNVFLIPVVVLLLVRAYTQFTLR